MAIVAPDALGEGLTAILEVTLDDQSAEAQSAFEARLVAEPEAQQVYRVASGPDFVLIVYVRDMTAYHAFVHRTPPQVAAIWVSIGAAVSMLGRGLVTSTLEVPHGVAWQVLAYAAANCVAFSMSGSRSTDDADALLLYSNREPCVPFPVFVVINTTPFAAFVP